MSYLTLNARADAEYTVNRSRFISHAAPVSGVEEANAFVADIRAEYPDATHNVFAFVVREPEYARYSDDGEPSGTSGMPVLQVIKGASLTNAAVVVTRYFGGILLGTGGLVRAYTQAAKLAVEAAGTVRMEQCADMRCDCPYSFYERLMRLIPLHGGVVEDTAFEDAVRLRLRVPAENADGLARAVREASFGAVALLKTGESYGKFDVL